jgi:succinoglycan biosynthesis transport protein ExoP
VAPSRPDGTRRIIKSGSGALWHVVNNPLSPFTEAVRSIKLAVDLSRSDQQAKVIGITSASPHEGKSTVACALALLMAQTNATTVLVDGDLRNPSLTRDLAPEARLGLLDVVLEKARLEDVIWTDESNALVFLPGIVNQQLAHTTEILASSRATALIETLRERYDNVVVDLSPLTPVVDVRATQKLIDAYVLVVEWGRTRVDLIEHALRDAQGLCDNLLGVVLNKVPPSETYPGNRRTLSSRYGYYGDVDASR